MSELNLHCHYQMIRNGTEFTVHEAFSTDKGVLHMIDPIPVFVVGDSEEDVSELASMIKEDVKRYPLVDLDTVQVAMARYLDHTNLPIDVVMDYSEDNVTVDDEDEAIDDGYDEGNDKVLDLCEYIKRNK